MRTVATSLSVPSALSSYVATGYVSQEAVLSARLIMEAHDVPAKQNPWVCFALAIVMENPATGNSCVRLEDLAKWNEKKSSSFSWLTSVSEWQDVLHQHPHLVGAGSNALTTPFVLDGNALYSQKAFVEESNVANRLCNMLLAGKLRVVTGGPGSGKTTSIAQQLIDYFGEPNNSEHSVALAAPTGLAAKRMKFALANALDTPEISAQISDEMRARILDLPKSTIHKLLKYNPSSRRQYRKNAEDQLDFDVVIIDEVSMMPLSMIAHVLDALPPKTTLVLVGDKDQLASVESGSVLADICLASDMGPSFVTQMTGKYRFGEGSPVAMISDAINGNEPQQLMESLTREYPVGVDTDGKELPRFTWVNPTDDPTGLNEVAKQVLRHARTVCEAASVARSDEDMESLLNLRGQLQLICAHRRGKFGVSGWNSTIDRKLGNSAKGQWYIGRPIMVVVNDYVNDLSNGDIGIVCEDEQGQRIAVFSGNSGIRRIPVTKLPPVETVHALTIHKSQGSEYAHTILMLPTQATQIVTRELVYTGITRAKPHLTLVSTPDVLLHAATTNIRRATGLADRLYDLLEAHQDRWPFVSNE